MLTFLLISCSENQPTIERNSVHDAIQTPDPQLPKESVKTDTTILMVSKQVLASLQKKDYKSFANCIHPALGVRFSPYAYIDTVNDITFDSDQFLREIKAQNKLNWGSYDGSGSTILLTTKDYFSTFVYNADFLYAEKTSLNKMIGFGNSLNNLESVYVGCDFTESYFSGFDKKYEGMDWCCLRLVFKKYLDHYYLVGIVHDQWTI